MTEPIIVRSKPRSNPYPVTYFLSKLYNVLAYLLFFVAIVFFLFFIEDLDLEYLLSVVWCIFGGLMSLSVSEGIKLSLGIEYYLFKIEANTQRPPN